MPKCKKCGREHGKFKNGNTRKTCPGKKRQPTTTHGSGKLSNFALTLAKRALDNYVANRRAEARQRPLYKQRHNPRSRQQHPGWDPLYSRNAQKKTKRNWWDGMLGD